jgi:ABC-type phosphate/phosphonate transport system substrate-binding protein
MKSFFRAVRTGAIALALTYAANASAEPERLTLGVFPGVESGQADSYQILNRYLPLAKYLSGKTGTEVLLLPVKFPDTAMTQMAQGKTSYKLFFGPPVFASDAIKKADFLPVAVEQERIRGAFVVKSDSKLRDIKDFSPTTRIAMPTPKLLLTILANETLASQKIILDPSARQHLTSTDGIVMSLDNAMADVAVMRDRAAAKLVAENPTRYRVVGQTVDAPGFALIAHKSVSESTRAKVRQAALALYGDPSPAAAEAREGLKTSPFVAGQDNEFAALQRLMDTWRPAN